MVGISAVWSGIRAWCNRGGSFSQEDHVFPTPQQDPHVFKIASKVRPEKGCVKLLTVSMLVKRYLEPESLASIDWGD